ncbi:MAG: sirohydrochlorin chelatase [Opitutales bacterium]
MTIPAIFLVDNGSLRAEATLALRRLAAEMSVREGIRIEAVSLLHSHKISSDKLGGKPATIVKRRMRELIAAGQRDFVILPLFLGPSLAITDYLPNVMKELRLLTPDLRVRIAEPLAGPDVARPDGRLAMILSQHLLPFLEQEPGSSVALIDHGTPIEPVNTLRNAVAAQLAQQLGRAVQPCSMERRDGPEYAFNEPLLENLGAVDRGRGKGGQLTLAMFFLLPGRHAGAGGDVAAIADGLIQRGSYDAVKMTPLLAESPRLQEILSDRLRAVL